MGVQDEKAASDRLDAAARRNPRSTEVAGTLRSLKGGCV